MMSHMTTTALRVVPYTRDYRATFNDMMFFSSYMHLHLDWSHVDTWLHSDDAIAYVALYHDRAIGFLGASRPIMGKTWIRVAVFKDETAIMPALYSLWDAIQQTLILLQATDIYWMIFDDWLYNPLSRLGLSSVDEVITFVRYNSPMLISTTPYTIRSANMNDVDVLFEIDKQAFAPMWQMTHDDMRYARRVASVCTMALHGDEIVGFQLSTMHHHNGHLARLAVLPKMQGKGVGSALVSDLVRYFNRRHLDYVSVNTQLSNTASQHVYTKLGFVRNGYDMPIWGIPLTKS
ncbi:MAG: hypothetical protein CUN52_08345 [Phototrophicales bacterium]|nr:MAG: hypothetical protein CUN52_08345 [Phototrophicales bacterium]